ncbi:MAG: hypothetical protein KF816_09010 [Melioribacteraceae bacterium]|nr:hypothetical protein [Melioribacteraceae bacterium]
MDNIFELLIFLFVIYSVVSSIFKQKKQPNKKNPQDYQDNDDGDIIVSPSNKNVEVLEDLFGFKIPKDYQQKPKPQTQRSESLETSSWDPESEFEKKINTRETLIKREIEKINKIPNFSIEQINQLEAKAKKKVKDDLLFKPATVKKDTNKRNTLITDKLRDSTNLRDVVILTEILKKPKALR